MIRRLFRWAFYAIVLLIVLIVAGILLMDTIARSIAENRIRRETGMDVKIGSLRIGLGSSSVTIENFKLYNTAEFGGSPFIDLPELHLEIDRDAFRANRLHFRLVRINLSQIHVVQNKDGLTNIQALRNKGKTGSEPGAKKPPGPTPHSEVAFDRIDALNLTLGKAKFTSFKYPQRNRVADLATRDEIYQHVTAKDLDSIILAIALKRSAEFLVEGFWSNPVRIVKDSSMAGQETRKVLEEVALPLKKIPLKR